MSRPLRKLLSALLLGLVACTSGGSPQATVTSVSVSPSSGSVAVGATLLLSAQVEVQNGASSVVAWTSSDPSKASVNINTGLVAGVAAGTTTITATSVADASKKGTATITITGGNSAITAVSISPKSASIPVGATQQFSASVSGTGSVDQSIKWTSSNPSVASIDTNGLVSAKAPGNTNISAESIADPSKKDSAGLSVTAAGPLTFSNYPTLIATTNQAISPQNANISGGLPPYSFTALTSLPAGLILNPDTGAISGTPTTATPANNYLIQVKDSQGTQVSATINITVIAPTPTLTYITPKALTVGRPITNDNFGLTTRGLVGGLSFGIVSGSLPDGTSLNQNNGTLSGAPTAAGTNSLVIRVTDAVGTTAEGNLNLLVNPAPTFSSPYPAQTATVGVTFTSSTPTISGGTAPLTFSASSLPAGLSINPPSGTIVGVPSSPSSPTNYTVNLTDANGAVVSTSVSIKVNSALILTYTQLRPLTDGIAITNLNYSRTISGGAPPYTYSAEAGELPGGIILDSNTGLLSGSTTDSGPFDITITATDSTGATAVGNFELLVNEAPELITDYSDADLQVNVAFTSSTPVVSKGTAPLIFSAASLPAGLAINPSTGVISGAPTTPSVSKDYPVLLTDANGATEKLVINLTIDP